MVSAEAKKGFFSIDSGYPRVDTGNSPYRKGKTRRILKKKKQLLTYLWMGGILIFLMIASTVIQVLLTQSQQGLNQLSSEINQVEKELGQLRYEVASLQSCKRIESLATDKLGMHPAQTINNLHVALVSPVPQDKPEVTLYLLAGKIPSQNIGVMQRITAWFSGMGKTLAEPESGL